MSQDLEPVLCEHLRLSYAEALRSYEHVKDQINSAFALAGRLQSGAHISELTRAVGSTALDLIVNARGLPGAATIIDEVESTALAAFDELAANVRDIAIGLNGRTPCPPMGTIADRFASKARSHVEGQLAKWRLEVSLAGATAGKALKRNPDAWPNEKIIQWIKDSGHTNGTKARNAFMAQPDTAGLTSVFQELWGSEHRGVKKGRPKNKLKTIC